MSALVTVTGELVEIGGYGDWAAAGDSNGPKCLSAQAEAARRLRDIAP